MKKNSCVLVVNSFFPEINHLAAALAEANLLSCYVRPYANMGRSWEKMVSRFPAFGGFYSRTFGRRLLPQPLSEEHIREVAIGLDFATGLHLRLPFSSLWHQSLRNRLIYRMWDSVARVGAEVLTNEKIVVASWRCAQPVFEKAKNAGVICVLNYPFAHHAFASRYLMEEAELEPGFVETLNGHDWPQWQIDRVEREIELSDYILVGSNFVKKSFINEGVPEQKLITIPYGADNSLFKPDKSIKKSPNNFNVLFVGQISQRKGLSYLLRAYERIHSPRTSLTLVGGILCNNEFLEPWRHLFRHIPHVTRSELAKIFQQADVFLFPTLMEGMPLVVVEAMASGLPVVTTPNGPGDIVRDGIDGFVVPPRDVNAIVKCLEELKENPELRASMSVSARERSLSFTWRHYRDTVINKIYRWLDEKQAL